MKERKNSRGVSQKPIVVPHSPTSAAKLTSRISHFNCFNFVCYISCVMVLKVKRKKCINKRDNCFSGVIGNEIRTIPNNEVRFSSMIISLRSQIFFAD